MIADKLFFFVPPKVSQSVLGLEVSMIATQPAVSLVFLLINFIYIGALYGGPGTAESSHGYRSVSAYSIPRILCNMVP